MENELKEATNEMKCINCGRLFEKDDIDYLTIHGNIYAGETGRLYSDSLPCVVYSDKFSKGDIRKQRICLSCFIEDLEQLRLDAINELSMRAIDLTDKIKVLANKTDIDIPEFLKKR